MNTPGPSLHPFLSHFLCFPPTGTFVCPSESPSCSSTHTESGCGWRQHCFGCFCTWTLNYKKRPFLVSLIQMEELPLGRRYREIYGCFSSRRSIPLSGKVGLQLAPACVNIMYTTRRSIHLVPMKYREWAGRSASLTSLCSAIRLSAIMAHHVSGGLDLGCSQKPNAVVLQKHHLQTCWWGVRSRLEAAHSPTCLIWEL